MCRFRQRKAFTIVEMVIVIAVIAILATVLVPTISGVIQQANLSTDKQFAASLNVQLALWQVDNGIITDVDDLQEAIDSYYGDDYFTDELKAKSANQGYQYWYVLQKGVMIVATPDNIYDVLAEHGISADDLVSISAPATAEPVVMFLSARQGTEQTNSIVSLSSKEGGATPGDLYDFGFGLIPVGKGNKDNKDSKNLSVIDVITMFNTIEGPNDYEDAINALHELKERYKDKHEKHPYKMAVDELIEKIETTAIITEAGAFRYGDVDNVNQVYISKTAKYINVENVYHYVEEELDNGTTGKYVVEAGDGAQIANPDTPIAINIPKKAKVAPNGLNFGHNKIDVGATEEECANVPTINVKTNNVEDLKAIFDKMATDCILVTKDGKKYVIIGEKIHEFPLESLENPVISDLEVSDIPTHITGGQTGVKPEIDVDLTLDPETDKNAGTGSIYYDKTTNILFVAYDRATPFTISTSGAHSSLLEWVITDQVAKLNADGTEVKDSEGKTVFETAESDWLVRNGNAFTINHKLAVGEDPYVTVTVKVKGTETEKSIRVYLVRPTDVLFDLDINTNIAGVTDNAAERPDGINLTFDGEKYLFEIKNAKIQYNASGKVLPKELSFSVASSNYFEIVTESGKTYLKMKENPAGYNFSETLIAKYGEDTVEFKINMIDNSASAFENNWIVKDQVQMGVDYLFRVGNENAFELGKLFDNIKVAKNVVLEIYDKTAGNGSFMIGSDSTFKATVKNATDATPIKDGDKVIGWQISSNNWKNVTIDFDGKGVAQIRIGNKIGDKFDGYAELLVEVVDGKNVTKYGDLKSSGNNVLLSDITMSSGGSYKLSNGTLFGNGYTFDVTDSATTGTGTITGNHIVYLVNANLDNIKIVGKVYKEFDPLTKSEYSHNRPAVLVQGECGIYNSYISNTASPVRVQNANVLIENTTLKGGSFSNLDIRSGQVTVKNVTTINQVNANDAADDGTVVVGLGITIWYDGTPTETRLTVAGSLTQYNNISSDQKGNATSDYTNAVVSEFFKNSNLSAFRTDGSPSWGNMGIISMIKTFNGDCVLNANGTAGNPSGYTGKAVSMTVKDAETGLSKTVDGYVWMIPKADVDSTTVPAAWVPTAQSVIAPTYSFDYTNKNYDSKADEKDNDYCYYDSTKGMVLIGMDQGDKFNWNTSILTAKKNDETLSYTVSMNGTDYTGKSITFDTEGTYTVVYTYTDSNNYNKDGSSFSVTYTKKVTINVVVKAPDAKNAEFAFWGANAKTVKIGDKIYVMPNVTGTSSTIGSTTVSGTTVYCPIVEAFPSNNKYSQTSGTTWYMYFPVFKDPKGTGNNFLTITDYENKGLGTAVTYGDSTTTLPAGLSVNNPSTTFQYSSASTAPTTPTTSVSGSGAGNLLVYTSPATEGVSRNEMTITATYTYTDNAGTTYYYVVKYHCKAVSNSACVTGDTLVTLADGTQARVDSLTGNELLRVWDHTTGTITFAPIAYIVNHDETISEHNVVKMAFSDGNYLEIIGEHVFFDKTLNKYVAVTADNVNDYIGHVFVSNEGDGLKEVVLTGAENIVRNTGVYEVVTYKAITCFTNGILSASAYLDPLLNVFDMNADTLVYDEAKMLEDIATYGLYTYEDFKDLVPEEAFEMYNAAYLKIAVGKGYITWDDILSLIDIYYNNDVTPLQ